MFSGRNPAPHPSGRESDPLLRFNQYFLALLDLVAQSAGNGDTYVGFVGAGMGVVWKGKGVCNEPGGGKSGRGRLGVGPKLKGEATT